MCRLFATLTLALFALAWGQSRAVAAPIAIPNASFETPAATFVSVNVDSWQKGPKPDWFIEGEDDHQWAEQVGLFRNTPPSSTEDHKFNINGLNAMWIFATPDVEVFQDYDSVDANDPTPTHAFNAQYMIGHSYDLVVGVVGGGGDMYEGVGLEISLYYRNAAGNKVTIAATTVLHSFATFPNRNYFKDFRVHLPVVKPGDAWSGQHIGIRMRSLTNFEDMGGYWDVDNVRLTATPGPFLPVTQSRSGGNVSLSWPSVAGYAYQVEQSTTLQAWSDAGAPLAGTGALLSRSFAIQDPGFRFYRVKVTKTP